MKTKIADTVQFPLAEHHQHLESMFCKLAYEVRCDDQAKLRVLWSEFESELLQHLRFEEEEIIPKFSLEHPDAARMILLDHDMIRQMLLEIGIGIDLHLLRADASDRFIAFLRAHAAREDELFYPWIAESYDRSSLAQFAVHAHS